MSCKSFNQLRDEEGFTTKEEFCNNIFLDIMRINCNGEGVTSRSYNIDNILHNTITLIVYTCR